MGLTRLRLFIQNQGSEYVAHVYRAKDFNCKITSNRQEQDHWVRSWLRLDTSLRYSVNRQFTTQIVNTALYICKFSCLSNKTSGGAVNQSLIGGLYP